ncbi:hypothetical protein L1987_74711 [Smallanthus sonchifolius]|uniref:Uncharacterized protein n=1 Tax=Smallanthus sonchifolius TaxID=185202 RepID=A0ACB9A4G3_9ASTR|nr:hypothetical protein L1987_74711 [Smallanthus sonchifolius]
MAGASKSSIRCQTKSISLPCRSHPITSEIEELLNKIKTTAEEAASADAICRALSQLTRLYKSMDDLLTSSTTHVLMSREQNKKWVDEFVDDSVKYLDICKSISDMLSEIKVQNRELVCALRRKKGELSCENSIKKYNCFRKRMKKDVRGLIGSLKRVDNTISGGSVVVDSDDHQLAAVIKALMHKGIVTCEDQQENGIGNEFEGIDAALRILCKYGVSSEMGNVQIAQCSLERLGDQIESMEGGLECIFRCLVGTRVSFLNIISH